MLLRSFSIILFCCTFSLEVKAQIALDSEEFSSCITNNAYNQEEQTKCYMNEAKSYVAEIDKLYARISRLPKIKLIKQFSDDTEGYFRQTLNAWKLYVKNFCEIKANTESMYSGDSVSFCRAKCLYIMSKISLNKIGGVESDYHAEMAN